MRLLFAGSTCQIRTYSTSCTHFPTFRSNRVAQFSLSRNPRRRRHTVALISGCRSTAIHRFEQVVDWRVAALEHRWAGLRSFAPDRRPVYGFDPATPGLFWCAGQGGFGIQTAPAAALLGAALLGAPVDPLVSGIDADRYAPARLRR